MFWHLGFAIGIYANNFTLQGIDGEAEAERVSHSRRVLVLPLAGLQCLTQAISFGGDSQSSKICTSRSYDSCKCFASSLMRDILPWRALAGRSEGPRADCGLSLGGSIGNVFVVFCNIY